MSGWSQWRLYVAPAYLILAIIMGGSGPHGILGNSLLELIGVVILAWAFLTPRRAMVPPKERRLNFLIAAFLLLVILQLVPVPPSLWAKMPFRADLLADERALGLATGSWRPISLAPYETVDAALMLIPPFAMLAAILKLEATRQRYLAAALFATVFVAIVLGIFQVSGPPDASNPFYPYALSSFGLATGFFHNANLMALLQLIAIPFGTATASAFAEHKPGYRKDAVIYLSLAIGTLLIVVGLYLNGSLFGYAMLVPVLASSLLMLRRSGQNLVKISLLAFAIMGALGVIALSTGLVAGRQAIASSSSSLAEHQRILENSIELLDKAGPLGTGLGTFLPVYRMEEPRKGMTNVYANAVHNDYIQLAIEGGWVGAILGLMALIWWLAVLLKVRTSTVSDQYAWAGAIASGTILMHSLVEFPLRTPAIAVIFAMCVALMLQSRRHLQEDKDLRPTRHVVID